MLKRLKCPKCWHIAEYELSGGEHTLFRGKLAIMVRCKKCGKGVYTPETADMLDYYEEVIQ